MTAFRPPPPMTDEQAARFERVMRDYLGLAPTAADAAVAGPVLYSEVAAALHANGYRPVPILPRQKRPPMDAWQNYQYDENQDLDFPYHGCGLILGAAVAVDIDVRDPVHVDALVRILGEVMPEFAEAGAPRRVGAAPKTLYLFRASAPFSKITGAEFKLPGDAPGDKAHKVEVLADGQQFVAYGVHPDTGAPYVWNGAGDPTTIPIGLLPSITEAQAREYVRRSVEYLASVGERVGGGVVAGPHGEPNPEQRAADPAEAFAALSAILADDRDTWIRAGMAFKGAVGDDGLEQFLQWSATSDKYVEADARARWASFNPDRIGMAALVGMARDHGWQREREYTAEFIENEVEAPAPTVAAAPHFLMTPATRKKPPHMIACEYNATFALAFQPKFADVHFDTFLQRDRIGERDVVDHDVAEALLLLQKKYAELIDGCKFEAKHAKAAMRTLARSAKRRRDVLREFIGALPAWDGEKRIDTAFHDAWGVVDTGENDAKARARALTVAAARNFFIALIARALRPGCKVDTVWSFEGPQGALKSTALRRLAGQARGVELHAEIAAQAGTVDFLRELQGVWLAEIAEMDALRGREATTVKRLLSALGDRWVEKYETYARLYPRRCVIVATTNESTYWQDSTGARRLVPVACGTIKLDLIDSCRLQWFAEALAAFNAGDKWWEFPVEIEAAQAHRQVVDPWVELIERYVQGKADVTVNQILAELEVDEADRTAVHEKRVVAALRALGWVAPRTSSRREGIAVRLWKKPDLAA